MHYDYSPFYAPFPKELLLALVPLIVIAVIWSITLKGFALWHAARGSQRWWFIIMLVVNTVGLLELVYLIWFRPRGSSTQA